MQTREVVLSGLEYGHLPCWHHTPHESAGRVAFLSAQPYHFKSPDESRSCVQVVNQSTLREIHTLTPTPHSLSVYPSDTVSLSSAPATDCTLGKKLDFTIMKVLIAGAGIGGLSAAIALKREGHQVHCYDRVREMRPIGAAISGEFLPSPS